MKNEGAEDTSLHGKQDHGNLVSGLVTDSQHSSKHPVVFKFRCRKRLEKLGNVAMVAKNCNEAVEYLSEVLSLGPADREAILLKRGNMQVLMESWDEALSDADEACIYFIPRCFRQQDSQRCSSSDSSHRPLEATR